MNGNIKRIEKEIKANDRDLKELQRRQKYLKSKLAQERNEEFMRKFAEEQPDIEDMDKWFEGYDTARHCWTRPKFDTLDKDEPDEASENEEMQA